MKEVKPLDPIIVLDDLGRFEIRDQQLMEAVAGGMGSLPLSTEGTNNFCPVINYPCPTLNPMCEVPK